MPNSIRNLLDCSAVPAQRRVRRRRRHHRLTQLVGGNGSCLAIAGLLTPHRQSGSRTTHAATPARCWPTRSARSAGRSAASPAWSSAVSTASRPWGCSIAVSTARRRRAFGMFGGYFYNSLTQARLFGVRSGAGWQAIDNAYFDNTQQIPPYVEEPWHISPRHSREACQHDGLDHVHRLRAGDRPAEVRSQGLPRQPPGSLDPVERAVGRPGADAATSHAGDVLAGRVGVARRKCRAGASSPR